MKTVTVVKHITVLFSQYAMTQMLSDAEWDTNISYVFEEEMS